MIKVDINEKRARYISSASDLPQDLSPEDLYTEAAIQVVNSVIASVLGGAQLLVNELKKEDEAYGDPAVEEEMIRLFYEVAHKVKLEHVFKVHHSDETAVETAQPAVDETEGIFGFLNL